MLRAERKSTPHLSQLTSRDVPRVDSKAGGASVPALARDAGSHAQSLAALRAEGRSARASVGTLDTSTRKFVLYAVVLGQAAEPLTTDRARSWIRLASAFALTDPRFACRVLGGIERGLADEASKVPTSEHQALRDAAAATLSEIRHAYTNNLFILLEAMARDGQTDQLPTRIPRDTQFFAQGLLHTEYDAEPHEPTTDEIMHRVITAVGHDVDRLVLPGRLEEIRNAILDVALPTIARGTKTIRDAISVNSLEGELGAHATSANWAFVFPTDSRTNVWKLLDMMAFHTSRSRQLDTVRDERRAAVDMMALIDPKSPFGNLNELVEIGKAHDERICAPDLESMIALLQTGACYSADVDAVTAAFDDAATATMAGAFTAAEHLLQCGVRGLNATLLTNGNRLPESHVPLQERADDLEAAIERGRIGARMLESMKLGQDLDPNGRMALFERRFGRRDRLPPEVASDIAQFLMSEWTEAAKPLLEDESDSPDFCSDRIAMHRLNSLVDRARSWDLTDAERNQAFDGRTFSDLSELARTRLAEIESRQVRLGVAFLDELEKAHADYTSGAKPIPDAETLTLQRDGATALTQHGFGVNGFDSTLNRRAQTVADRAAQLVIDKTNASLPAGLRLDRPVPW